MKFYGRICHDLNDITDEKVLKTIPGVTVDNGKYKCNQCTNTNQSLFYHYYCYHCNKETIYCRSCIQLGKVQSCKDIYVIESYREKTPGYYKLDFKLSPQQELASQKVSEAILSQSPLLLHAVTGAGKTEMIFEGISLARRKGYNVAVVSPRVDVVKEVYLRLKDAFVDEEIDLLYEGQFAKFNSTFIVSTVHQLMRYYQHFDVVIVDEVDAFPLEMDNQLMTTIRKATHIQASHIYLTATPNKQLRLFFKDNQVTTLPARYHGHSLPIPEFHYNIVKTTKVNNKLLKFLKRQVKESRKTFVFFHDIKYMESVFKLYAQYFSKIECVSSQDSERHEKVNRLRNNEVDIMFTTTILERGVTLPALDVVIIRTDMFTSSAIIQIAGRVGRKVSYPKGNVICFHRGITKEMDLARKEIMSMNKLAKDRGWLK